MTLNLHSVDGTVTAMLKKPLAWVKSCSAKIKPVVRDTFECSVRNVETTVNKARKGKTPLHLPNALGHWLHQWSPLGKIHQSAKSLSTPGNKTPYQYLGIVSKKLDWLSDFFTALGMMPGHTLSAEVTGKIMGLEPVVQEVRQAAPKVKALNGRFW